MSKQILVIGASGQVGSAAVRASLRRGYTTLAFLRTPSKLPTELSNDSSIRIIQGSALDSKAVETAVNNDGNPLTCVVLCAPFGNPTDKSKDWEEVATIVTDAVRKVQDRQEGEKKKTKLWILSGQFVMSHPDFPNRHLNSFLPFAFFPGYIRLYNLVKKEYDDVDWTFLCPGRIKTTQPTGKVGVTLEVLADYRKPWAITRWIPFELGYAANIMYNLATQNVTLTTLGDYMIEHCEADGKLKGKRVALLEEYGN